MAIPSPLTTNWLILGLCINVLAHTLYGSEPALTRAMQTVHQWPTLFLVGAIHLLAFLFYTPRLLQRAVAHAVTRSRKIRDNSKSEKLSDDDGDHSDVLISNTITTSTIAAATAAEEDDDIAPISEGRNAVRRVLQYALHDVLLGNWVLISFALLVSFRVATNIYTPKLITAFYVQLITLTNPFMVSIFSVVLIREKFTYHTIVAMVFMLLGGVLVVVGNSNSPAIGGGSGFSWTIDFTTIGSDLGYSDLFGIILAFISTAVFALSFVVIKVAGSKKDEPSATQDELAKMSWRRRFVRKYTRTYHAETLFIVQALCLIPMGFIGSVIVGEDWTPMFQTNWSGLAVIISLGLIFVVGALCNVYMIWILGATNATTTIPLRLISTLLVAGILMGEWLHNIAQVLGGIIVFVSVTWYLLMLRKIHQREQEQSRNEPKEVGVQCALDAQEIELGQYDETEGGELPSEEQKAKMLTGNDNQKI